MDFKQLHEIALATLNPRKLARKSEAGHVAAALLTDKGNVYKGVCLDTVCALGYCAEYAAISAMITAGEHKIAKLIAVDEDGSILAPCGKCRELISQIHPDNGKCEVMLQDEIVTLNDLLPQRWDLRKEGK